MFIKIDQYIFNKNNIRAILPFLLTEIVVYYGEKESVHIKCESMEERAKLLDEIWTALDKKGK